MRGVAGAVKALGGMVAWGAMIAQGQDGLEQVCLYECPEGSTVAKHVGKDRCPHSFADCNCPENATRDEGNGQCVCDGPCLSAETPNPVTRFEGDKVSCAEEEFKCPPFSWPKTLPELGCRTSLSQCKCLNGFKPNNSLGVCVPPARQGRCWSLSGGKFKKKQVNVVIVPSGFGDDMDAFKEEVWKIYSAFSTMDPLNAERIPQLNIFAAFPEEGAYNEASCRFNCAGIPRLLCCDSSPAIAQSIDSCGKKLNMELLVVHNSETYGGAGGYLATTTRNSLGPLVAAHELGHSVFNLADEYKSGRGTPYAANCDYEGCSKWGDLIGKEGVGCFANACKGGSYYSSTQHSIMGELTSPWGLVNERVTCCMYLSYKSRVIPKYCRKFSKLKKYCASGLWELGGGSSFRRRLERHEYSASLVAPELITFRKRRGSWVRSDRQRLDAGEYHVTQTEGDWNDFAVEEFGGSPLSVELVLEDEPPRVLATFLPYDVVEVPPAQQPSIEGDEIVGEDDGASTVAIPRTALQVVVETQGLPPTARFSVREL